MIDHFEYLLLVISLLLVLCIASPRCSDLNTPAKYRIAIGFYGLSRSLETTLPSIERHVFEVLDKNDIVYDVFWSSLDADHITNQRSGEMNLTLDSADFTLMRPCVLSVISQSVIAPVELKLYQQARIGFSKVLMDKMFHDGFKSLRNLLAAFHSLRTANSMIHTYSKLNNIAYDAVVILRPDTAVVTDIDIPQYLDEIIQENRIFESQGENSSYPQPIWIPDFEYNGGYNDRGAYGSMQVMSKYMTRSTAFRDYVDIGRNMYLNGENYLQAYLHAYNITFRPSALRVVRVRADKSISHVDLSPTSLNMDSSQYASFLARCVIGPTSKGPHYLNATSC